MEEHGLIIRKKNAGIVVIRAQRTSACDGCASKNTCGTGGAGNEMLIEADNPVGADVGDRVVFTVGAGSVLKAGLMLYLVPVISFIAGVVLGQTVSVRVLPGQNPDLVSGALGVIFLAAAFAGLKVYGSMMEKGKSFRPRVLRVV
ncbi:MAG: SoxR reducing system RseC family protein [Deltaproteobacteria bacterium]